LCHICTKVNILLAGGRTLTSGFSHFEGTNFKDGIKQFCARDVRLHCLATDLHAKYKQMLRITQTHTSRLPQINVQLHFKTTTQFMHL
jgi:hypothetical protein